MGRTATNYKVTGRFINKDDLRDVVGYRIQSQSNGSTANVTIEQLAFLIGRGRILNCDAQIYKDKILFRGVGIKLDELPSAKVAVNKKEKVDTDNTRARPTSNDKQEKQKTHQGGSEITGTTQGGTSGNVNQRHSRVFDEMVSMATEIFNIDSNKIKKEAGQCSGGNLRYKRFVGSAKSKLNNGSTYITYISYKGKDSHFNDINEVTVEIHEYTKDKKDRVLIKRLDKDVLYTNLERYKFIFNAVANNKEDVIRGLNVTIALSKYYETLTGVLQPVSQYACDLADKYEDTITVSTLYDKVIAAMDKKYSNFAYKMTELVVLKNDIRDTAINIDKETKDLVYISMNKWGFEINSNEPGTREKLVLNRTTFNIISATFPESLTYNDLGFKQDEYKQANYHQVVIRLRAFRHLTEFTMLKYTYIKLNAKVFDNKLSNKTIVSAGNYALKSDYRSVIFETLKHCSAYWSSDHDMILFNGMYNTLQGKALDEDDTTTLLHEMCHSYAEIVYGTNWEENPEDMGDKLYGISREKYGVQVQCHGRKFGMAVQLAAERSGYTFADIFSYNVKGEISHPRDLAPDNTTRTIYTDVISEGYAGYKSVKSWFEANADGLIQEVDKYDNWFEKNLNVRVHIFKDDKTDDGREQLSFRIQFINQDGTIGYMYRMNLFGNGGWSNKITGTLIRDYGIDFKGYKLGVIQISETSLGGVANKMMKRIRNDIVKVA